MNEDKSNSSNEKDRDIDRLWWHKIDSVGTFPDGRVKMDIILKDSNGKKYVWTPKWKDEVMKMEAEAQRVEEINKGEWEEELKNMKKFSDEVLDEIASIILNTRSEEEVPKFFEQAGFPDLPCEAFEQQKINVDMGYLEPDALLGFFPHSQNDIHEKLRELNKSGYQNVMKVLQKLANPKQYIGDEGKHIAIVERMNKALKYENLKVTENGEIGSETSEK